MKKQRNNQKRSRRNPKGKTSNRSKPTQVTGFPSPVKSQPVQVRTLRLAGTGATGVDVNFSYLDLLTSISFASTTTLYTSLFGSVKLNRITLSVTPTSTENGSITFGWKGTRTPKEESTFFYANGQASKMSFTPPPESFADYWFSGTSAGTDTVETVWTIRNDGTADIIMDLHFSYILIDGSGWGNSCTATTALSIFASKMPRGGVLFVPVGLNSTQIV